MKEFLHHSRSDDEYYGTGGVPTWWSASLYVLVLGLLAVYALRRHERHHRSEAYDDKLSAERMDSAREWLLGN